MEMFGPELRISRIHYKLWDAFHFPFQNVRSFHNKSGVCDRNITSIPVSKTRPQMFVNFELDLSLELDPDWLPWRKKLRKCVHSRREEMRKKK